MLYSEVVFKSIELPFIDQTQGRPQGTGQGGYYDFSCLSGEVF